MLRGAFESLRGWVGRFALHWAGVFGLLVGLGTCPHCGNPACGVGAAGAGVLAGLTAAVTSLAGRRRRTDAYPPSVTPSPADSDSSPGALDCAERRRTQA